MYRYTFNGSSSAIFSRSQFSEKKLPRKLFHREKFLPLKMELTLTLLHSEWPKLYGVLAILTAVGLKEVH